MQEEFLKALKEAEDRVIRKIRRRMRVLLKDKQLIKQIDKDLKRKLGNAQQELSKRREKRKKTR